MKRDSIRKKMTSILDNAPGLREIFLSSDPLEKKRAGIRVELTRLLATTFDDNPDIPPLEWVEQRDAIRVFRTIVSKRSERLSGFSFLQYFDDLLNKEHPTDHPQPEAGFFAEMEHLFKAVTGSTGMYSPRVPAFLKQGGRKAALARSKDLSVMAGKAQAFMDRYPSGLDDDHIRRRSQNKARILAYFEATDHEWDDWKWQVGHVIRDAETLGRLIQLKPEEEEAVRLAKASKVPFGITPYYLSLLDHESGSPFDYATRAQVIPPLSYVRQMKAHKECLDHSMDFMLERDTSPIDGVTRRYPMICILKPVMTCPQICVYCQRNWEIEDVYSANAAVPRDKLDKAIDWIARTGEIKEVLVTGGDPFLLPDDKIEYILERLSSIDHIDRIRIGTRTPVTMPMRITETLARTLNRFHVPGRRELIIITHFEHQYEVTPQSLEAVQKLRRYGLEVYNQLVYTFYNSRKFEAADLRHKLRLTGVTPYYTFNTKGKEETGSFRVPIARLLQEQKEEARLMPGTVRTDEIVFNVPRMGKNYLRAEQHHDVIAILPDGRRVYEFHPWEKKLALVDTYVYTDVSIHEYLQRLKSVGEDLKDYKSIWYYY